MTSDATQLGIWVLAASQVMTGLVMLRKLSGGAERREISPQPLEVKPSPEYAPRLHEHPQYITRDDCHAAHQQASQAETAKIEQVQRQIDHLSQEMKTTLTDHNRQAEARSSSLHARIDPISKLAQSTTDRLNDHFEDHRNGRFDNAG